MCRRPTAWAQVKKINALNFYDLCRRPTAYGLGTSKKPDAFYDPCLRPMAWVRVKKKKTDAVDDPGQLIIQDWAAGLLLAKPGVPAELHLECSANNLEYEHQEIVFGSTEDLTWHFITV